MTAGAWLKSATSKLQTAGVPSARLDAELILAHATHQNRESNHAHSDRHLPSSALIIANQLLRRRKNREPLAYLVGQKEFYGRSFIVNQNVLIPRPESEEIINIAKNIAPKNAEIIDIGTGSGCLGITIKLELPSSRLTLSDISPKALKIAKTNAKNLSANVTLLKSDLFQNVKQRFNLVIANLPYLDVTWHVSPETRYEPTLALFAKEHGEALYHDLLAKTPSHLKNGGFLVLEADMRLHANLINFAKFHKLRLVQTSGLILVFTQKPNVY
jgi:release factor glutamine methyltransferase